MREILFRGKWKDTGGWVYGAYGNHTSLDAMIIDRPYLAADGDLSALGFWPVHPATVGQYTGLTDKNGVKIFEGDIVEFQFDNDDCPFPNKDIKKRVGRVFFKEFRASFAIAMGKDGSSDINDDLFKYVQNGNRVSVIGTVYDNPELLAGGKNQ